MPIDKLSKLKNSFRIIETLQKSLTVLIWTRFKATVSLFHVVGTTKHLLGLLLAYCRNISGLSMKNIPL